MIFTLWEYTLDVQTILSSEWEGEVPVAMVYIGTNNTGRTRKEVMLRDCEDLGENLKAVSQGNNPHIITWATCNLAKGKWE